MSNFVVSSLKYRPKDFESVVGQNHVFVSSAQLGGVADNKIDPKPFWEAMLQFDKNKDDKISRTEMVGDFT